MAKKYYVILAGWATGIFTDWATVKMHTDGYSYPKFKGFNNILDVNQA